MKPDKAPSLGRILESAVILGWSDLMKDAKSGVLHLEYAFTPDSKAVIISYGGKIWRVPVDGSAATGIPFRVQTKAERAVYASLGDKEGVTHDFAILQKLDPQLAQKLYNAVKK